MTEPQAHDIPAEPPAASIAPSPGALLRAAREKAGLTAEDLGGQLKLAKGTLEALERDDFAALSEPVYVRGYYRKIAKLLPVPEKALIDAYNARSKPARTVATMTPSRIPLAGGVAAGASTRFPYAGVMLGLAAAAVAVIMFIFVDRPAPRRIPVPETSATAEAPVQAPAQTSAPVVAAPSQTAPQTAPAVALPSSPESKPAPAATAPAADTGPVVPNQLVLSFSESSFVRVEDSRGKTLAIGLVRAGERQALDGTPPYTVFLGNAKNVKVFFSGQPVDFSAHVNAQNDTARFMVP